MCHLKIISDPTYPRSQIHHVAYPFGPDAGMLLHKVPMDLAAISKVVQAVYVSRGGDPAATEPAISAEQLMYSSMGERVVSRLMGRYQWQDVYTSTRIHLL